MHLHNYRYGIQIGCLRTGLKRELCLTKSVYFTVMTKYLLTLQKFCGLVMRSTYCP